MCVVVFIVVVVLVDVFIVAHVVKFTGSCKACQWRCALSGCFKVFVVVVIVVVGGCCSSG